MVCPPFNETECKMVCTFLYLRKYSIKYNLENNMFPKVVHTYVIAYLFWCMFYFHVYIKALLYFFSLPFWVINGVSNNVDSPWINNVVSLGF